MNKGFVRGLGEALFLPRSVVGADYPENDGKGLILDSTAEGGLSITSGLASAPYLADSAVRLLLNDPAMTTSGATWTTDAQASGGPPDIRTDNTQNATISYSLARALQAGTYTMRVFTGIQSDLGIFTVSTSPNNATWTALTTFDCYAAGGSTVVLTQANLAVPTGVLYLRMVLATKNASSSNYGCRFHGADLARTA